MITYHSKQITLFFVLLFVVGIVLGEQANYDPYPSYETYETYEPIKNSYFPYAEVIRKDSVGDIAKDMETSLIVKEIGKVYDIAEECGIKPILPSTIILKSIGEDGVMLGVDISKPDATPLRTVCAAIIDAAVIHGAMQVYHELIDEGSEDVSKITILGNGDIITDGDITISSNEY